MSKATEQLVAVCSKAEIERVRHEGELRGLKYRAAQLRVILLDAQLAVAVAECDKTRAQQLAAELKRALFDLESVREFEAIQNVHLANLISSMTWENN